MILNEFVTICRSGKRKIYSDADRGNCRERYRDMYTDRERDAESHKDRQRQRDTETVF